MKKIIVCVNFRSSPDQPSCAARGSVAIAACIESEIIDRALPIAVERVNCLGHCEQGPNVRLVPNGRFFHRFGCKDLAMLLAEASECADDRSAKI